MEWSEVQKSPHPGFCWLYCKCIILYYVLSQAFDPILIWFTIFFQEYLIDVYIVGDQVSHGKEILDDKCKTPLLSLLMGIRSSAPPPTPPALTPDIAGKLRTSSHFWHSTAGHTQAQLKEAIVFPSWARDSETVSLVDEELTCVSPFWLTFKCSRFLGRGDSNWIL